MTEEERPGVSPRSHGGVREAPCPGALSSHWGYGWPPSPPLPFPPPPVLEALALTHRAWRSGWQGCRGEGASTQTAWAEARRTSACCVGS